MSVVRTRAPFPIAVPAGWPEREEVWELTDRQFRIAFALMLLRERERLIGIQREQNNQEAARRRARMRRASGHHTRKEWQAKLAEHGHCCAYCGRADVALTRDHVIPLIARGSDSIDNIVPACVPCNSRKGTRLCG